jgi:hypothetical protein
MAEIFADRLQPEGGTLHGRTYLIRGFFKSEWPPLHDEAIEDLQISLEFLTSPEDLEFCQKAHAQLAGLLQDKDEKEAMRHAEKAYTIASQLGLVDEEEE